MIYKMQNAGTSYIKRDENTCIREIFGKLDNCEELWYYPIYQVPVISKRCAVTRQKVLYEKQKDQFCIDLFEYKVPFESSGAFFFDAITGKLLDKIYVDSYFNRKDKSNTQLSYLTEMHTIKCVMTNTSESPDSWDTGFIKAFIAALITIILLLLFLYLIL